MTTGDDARAAYLAGSRDALLEQMTGEQQLHFRVILLQLSLSHLQYLHAKYLSTDASRTCLASIEEWIKHPTQTNSDALLARFIDEGVIAEQVSSDSEPYGTKSLFDHVLADLLRIIRVHGLRLAVYASERVIKEAIIW